MMNTFFILLLLIEFYIRYSDSFYTYTMNKKYLKNKTHVVYMNSHILLHHEELPKFTQFNVNEVEEDITFLLNNLEKDFYQLETKISQQTTTSSGKELYNLVIDEMEKVEHPLGFAWGIISHLLSVKNDEKLREIYEKLQPKIIELNNKMSQSHIVYKALEKILESKSLSGVRKRIVDAVLHSMKSNGIGLEEEKKNKLHKLKLRLAELSTKFSNNVMDSTKEFSLYIADDAENMSKMPNGARELFSQQAKEKFPDSTPELGPWKVTLDMPSYLPMMLHYPVSEIREKLYKAYISRASQGEYNNIPIIEELLKLKKEYANILGYNHYSELSLSTKMADNVTQIEDLLNMLSSKSKLHAINDLQEITNFANKHLETCVEKLSLWDKPYWSERYKEQLFDFKEEDLKPYFPIDSVLDGLFKLASNLFQIKIVRVDTTQEKIELWDPYVMYFNIYDENDEYIASFYLDPYSRPGEKRGGAWMNGCEDKSKYLNKKPIAYLICNGSPPILNDEGSTKIPSLMTFGDVETLFHEFGHGLQHMLTKVDEGGASGINNIEWDAVELPSQFMENWCYHRPTIMGFAKHYSTQEPLPDVLFNKILQQRTFLSGSAMSRQIYFSMLDLYLHSQLKDDENIMDIQKRFAEKYSGTTILDEDHFLCSFSHIFAGGYSSGYYSYKWAEIMSADAFGAFEEIDLNDPKQVNKIGLKFRNTVLALGGGTHPADVFRMFRGREPNIDALLRHNGL